MNMIDKVFPKLLVFYQVSVVCLLKLPSMTRAGVESAIEIMQKCKPNDSFLEVNTLR